MSTELHTYWAVSTCLSGTGAYFKTKQQAQKDLARYMELEPDDDPVLVSKRMTHKQYEALPESEGWD